MLGIKYIIDYFSLKRYIEDLGFDDFQAKETIKSIREMDVELKKHFYLWFNKNKVPDICIGEFTFKELTDDLKMNEIKAFLFMDWLKKDYLTAKKSLLRMTDSIVSSDKIKAEIACLLDEKKLKEASEDTSDIVVEDKVNDK